MMRKCLFLIPILLPALSLAADAQLVDEKEINKWGYLTLRSENISDDNVTIKKQVIKSKKAAKRKKYHYYYYSLTLECYDGRFAAIKRRWGLLYSGEKDYRRAELSGRCIRIIDTSANFATFTEQPRIFSLFNKYLDNETNGN